MKKIDINSLDLNQKWKEIFEYYISKDNSVELINGQNKNKRFIRPNSFLLNIMIVLFGPFVYFFHEMWEKGLFLLSLTCYLIVFLLCVFVNVPINDNHSLFISFTFSVLPQFTFFKDYYNKKIHNERMWKPFYIFNNRFLLIIFFLFPFYLFIHIMDTYYDYPYKMQLNSKNKFAYYSAAIDSNMTKKVSFLVNDYIFKDYSKDIGFWILKFEGRYQLRFNLKEKYKTSPYMLVKFAELKNTLEVVYKDQKFDIYLDEEDDDSKLNFETMKNYHQVDKWMLSHCVDTTMYAILDKLDREVCFFIDNFTWANDSNTTAEYYSIPTIFFFGDYGSMGLYKYEVSEDWIKTFKSKESAQIAYDILVEIFDNIKDKKEDGDNIFELYANHLKRIDKILKSDMKIAKSEKNKKVVIN